MEQNQGIISVFYIIYKDEYKYNSKRKATTYVVYLTIMYTQKIKFAVRAYLGWSI